MRVTGGRGALRWLALPLTAVLPGPAAAFSVLFGGGANPQLALADAARWAASSGLSDGIQVGVELGFATDLGAANPAEVALVNQAVTAGITAWENAALSFDVTLDAAGAVEGTSAGFEIDLFAVPGSHPVFVGTNFFGVAVPAFAFDAGRTLTNGQVIPGSVITGADVYFNIDLILSIGAFFGFTIQEEIDGLTRLVMHEVGHTIGLGHPNNNNPFGVENNYDTDLDPSNPMPIDPTDPFSALILSPNPDNASVMSNRPCGEPFVAPCPAIFFTSPTNDDLGGRDALYPVPEPGAALLLGASAGVAAQRLLRRSASARSSGAWPTTASSRRRPSSR